ncbi:MAG: hypothetical protein ACFCUQ_05610 [Kiloniellales bacterium]
MVLRLAFCLLALGSLSGCLLFTGPGLFIAGVATIVNTDKTPSDHAVSWMTGEDCSSVEYSKGRDYCVSDDVSATMADTTPYGASGKYEGYGPYCYRTLGKISCYNHPDPLASEQARLP